ncbi:MAG: transcriptional regulator with XRE-family HTH domain [Verrucomicrobiales bacterium]
MSDDERSHLIGLGSFIRSQRRLAELSQRELAKLTKLSDPYVSQIERGLHAPSVRVLRSLGKALNIAPETLMSYAGMKDDVKDATLDTACAIRQDPKLSDAQKAAMLEIYKGFTDQGSA